MKFSVRQVQQALNRQGFRLQTDGIMGPKTEAAISAFKGRHGLRRRPTIGPITAGLLFGDKPTKASAPSVAEEFFPPWVNELGRYMWLHEVRDKEKLSAWLKSDGAFLGDPSKLPWCGDAMQTAIRLTLPNEPFPGALGKNPYWARNWALFGKKHPLALGVMVPITRGKGGHIGTAVGYDPMLKRVRIRGGNQSNTINDTWIKEKRVIDYRAPVTWNGVLPAIPIMDASGQVISTNEA